MSTVLAAQAKNRIGGALGVLAAGALAVTGVVSAPSANASCASAFGLGQSAYCTSNLTSVAIAIGPNAEAHADGLFGAALAVGDTSRAETANAFTIAAAAGNKSRAKAVGLFGIAAQFGSNGFATTSGSNSFGNLAINLSPSTTVFSGSTASATGVGTVAVNLFGNGTVLAGEQVATAGIAQVAVNVGGTNNKVSVGGDKAYVLNSALNIGGSDNTVRAGRPPAGGNLNTAFSVFGPGNTVEAGPGPFAIAGAIGGKGGIGQTVTKQKPGININGVRIPNTAAATPSKVSPAATTRLGRNR